MDSIRTEASQTFRDELVRSCNALRRYARALTHNDTEADDLVQETLFEALRCEDRFESGSPMIPWLFTIERRKWNKRVRKQSGEKGFVSMDCKDWEPGNEDKLSVSPRQDVHLQMEDADRALSCLLPEYRECLLLVTVDGFTYEEVAEICNCPIGTVRSRVNRAKKELIQAYESGKLPSRNPCVPVADREVSDHGLSNGACGEDPLPEAPRRDQSLGISRGEC